MLKKLRGTVGFSLLETILATFLLGVALVAGMIALRNATLFTINSDFSSVATQLANEKIETILADKQYQGYAYLDGPENYPEETLSGEFKSFSRTVSIIEVNADDLTTVEEGSGVKLVTVTVDWGAQPNQQVTVRTLMSEII